MLLLLSFAGIKVDYKRVVAGIHPGPAVIHCIILCGLEITQLSVKLGSGGVYACRHD